MPSRHSSLGMRPLIGALSLIVRCSAATAQGALTAGGERRAQTSIDRKHPSDPGDGAEDVQSERHSGTLAGRSQPADDDAAAAKNRINENRWSIARFPTYSFHDGPAASYALIAAASIRTLFFSSSSRRSASARTSAIAEWRRAAALNSSSPETTSAQNDF